jgi:hypothetical protein
VGNFPAALVLVPAFFFNYSDRNDDHLTGVVYARKIKGDHNMRVLALAIAAAVAVGVTAVPVMAQDTTTVIKKHDDDTGRSKVIIKKKENTGNY